MPFCTPLIAMRQWMGGLCGGGDGSGQDPHGGEDDDGAVADVEDEEVVKGPVEEGYLLRRRQVRQVQVADLRGRGDGKWLRATFGKKKIIAGHST